MRAGRSSQTICVDIAPVGAEIHGERDEMLVLSARSIEAAFHPQSKILNNVKNGNNVPRKSQHPVLTRSARPLTKPLPTHKNRYREGNVT